MLSKKEVADLLRRKKYDDLTGRSSGNRKLIGMLISLSYDKSDVISWRAMEVIGLITGRVAASDPDFVRNTVGRLLWMIRDESGGIGWSAPESLGEIVRNNPELCADIAPIIASFHEEAMLCKGVMWALGRIGKLNTYFTDYAVPIATHYLDTPDSTLRGYAAWACGQLGAGGAADSLETLREDKSIIPFYEDHELKTVTVGEIAGNALDTLKMHKEVKAACH